MIASGIVRGLVQLRPHLGLALCAALRVSFLQGLFEFREFGLKLVVVRMIWVGEELGQVVGVQRLVLEAGRAEDRVLRGEVIGERVGSDGFGISLRRCGFVERDICYLAILSGRVSIRMFQKEGKGTCLIEKVVCKTVLALELATRLLGNFRSAAAVVAIQALTKLDGHVDGDAGAVAALSRSARTRGWGV